MILPAWAKTATDLNYCLTNFTFRISIIISESVQSGLIHNIFVSDLGPKEMFSFTEWVEDKAK